MNHLELSGIFTFLSSFICVLFVFFLPPRTKLKTIWSLFGLSVSVWGLGLYFAFKTGSSQNALFWLRVLNIDAILIPFFYYHFVVVFTNNIESKKKELLAYCLVSFIFLLIALIFPDCFVKGVSPRLTFNFYADPGWLYYLFPLMFGYLVINGAVLLIRDYRQSKNSIRRNQIKYFLLGTVIGFSGGATTFFPVFDLSVNPLGTYLVSAHVLTVSYGILKYKLMDIRIAVTRAGILLLLYAAVLGLPFYIGYKTQSWFITAICMFALASVGPILYRFAQKKAENLLLAEQKRYQKILLQAAGGMAHEHDLNRLIKLIVYIVKRTVNVSFAAILLEDREKKIYKMMAARDNGDLRKAEYTLPCEHPFIKYLNQKSAPVIFEEIPGDIQDSIVFPGKISLVVPSDSDGNPIGFLLLGEKLNGKVYSSDDINVFNILAQQTALAIENCMFIKEFKLAQEKLFSAEKLASIGGLAEGVAHQVNNRLNHFSMAAGEMKFELETFVEGHRQLIESNADFKKTFDYLKELAESINGNVRRTDGILKGILNYARIESRESMFTTFSVKEIVDLSVDLLKIKHHLPADFSVRIEPCESDALYGVKSQLLECVYNILDNAYEATLDKQTMLKEQEKDQYRTDISLKITQKVESVLLQFSDNGIGIRKEQHQKIFAPFFTTKSSYKSGTGIGMYVVKRMIEENHHGRIWFNSEFGAGTHIFIELPKRVI